MRLRETSRVETPFPRCLAESALMALKLNGEMQMDKTRTGGIDYAGQSQEIVRQIQEAEKLGQPIVELVKKHLEILEAYLDEFARCADAANIHNIERGGYEIRIYSMMKAWASKAGLPVEKYDAAMKKVRVQYFGEGFEERVVFIPKNSKGEGNNNP